MKKTHAGGALALALAATLSMSACSNSSNKASTDLTSQDAKSGSLSVNINKTDRAKLEDGGTLTLALSQMADNWNPWNSDGNLSEISSMMGATDPLLFDFTPEGAMSPNPNYLTKMPEVKEVGGKETVTYSINPKAKWNDGTPIDYTAFAATWNANKAPMATGGFNNVSTTGYEDIEKVEKGATDTEAVVTFKKKFYPVTEVFQGLLHPKVGNDKTVFNTGFTNNMPHNEYRAGAFIFDKIDPTNKTVTLIPNPAWWGEKPKLAKIIYRQMEDSATIPAFKNGELDVTGVSSKSRYTQIQGAKDLDIRRGSRLVNVVYNFNSKAEGLSDVNVRKALWQAFDRSEWKKIRYDGLNWTEPDLGSNLFLTFQKGYEDNFPVKQGAAEAQKTMDAAGYTKGADGFYAKDGKPVSVKLTTFGDDPTTTALAQLAQKQGKAAGIDVKLDIRASAAFSQAMIKKDFGIISMAYSPNSAYPITGVCQLMCSTNENNLSFAGTKEIDDKIAKLGDMPDVEAQAKAINAVEKEWMAATYGTMPIASGPVITAYRKGLANLGPQEFAGLNPHWENVGWTTGSTHN